MAEVSRSESSSQVQAQVARASTKSPEKVTTPCGGRLSLALTVSFKPSGRTGPLFMPEMLIQRPLCCLHSPLMPLLSNNGIWNPHLSLCRFVSKPGPRHHLPMSAIQGFLLYRTVSPPSFSPSVCYPHSLSISLRLLWLYCPFSSAAQPLRPTFIVQTL